MSRWFRSYADKHRNPKVARLSDSDFRLWDQLLCVASENEGRIPPEEDLKHLLNRRLDHLSSGLKRLVDGRLIEPLESGYAPRNWDEKQYKSDTSTPRVQKHRAERNVSRNVSETPPDTDTETDTEKEEVGGDKSPTSYAFFGQTIRLTPQHLARWRRTYHSITDVEAELTTLDAWWQSQPVERRKNWFHPTAGMLNRKHQENLSARSNYDPERITV